MKKGFFSVVILLCCTALFSGCIKTSPTVTTINPSMSVNIGSYNFIAFQTVPSTVRSQVHDTGTTLIITGYTSDRVSLRDRIVLTVTKYTGATGTFSIIQGDASATYYHGSVVSVAATGVPSSGGIVSIQKVTTTEISGYFSFNSSDGLSAQNGVFRVGLP